MYNNNNWEVKQERTRASYGGNIFYRYKPAYSGRFMIKEQGNYTIKALVGSNNGISKESLIIRLKISNKQINAAHFKGYLTRDVNYTATYTDYLYEGTYVYFYFEHGNNYINSLTELSKSFNNGPFELLNGLSECETCDEGDPCIDETRNKENMCIPYTFSAINALLVNDIARKSLISGILYMMIL